MFFIVANFTLAGILLIIGVLTLKKVSAPKEWVFATLPLLFGLHQFDQGIVWLGLYQIASVQTLQVAATLFVFYAQAVLPFWVPLAVWLLEPRGAKKNVLGLLVLIGALLAVYVAWGLILAPTHVYIRNSSLVYDNHATQRLWVAALYILTTCGSLIFSRSVAIQLFGWLNLAGLTTVYVVAQYSFTALWCLYAALVSAVLYLHFIERRIAFLRSMSEKEADLGQSAADELQRLTRLFPRLRKLISR